MPSSTTSRRRNSSSWKMIDDRIVKVRVDKDAPPRQGFTKYPYVIFPMLPDCDCVFDSRHGTIGFDVFPFAITTRIAAACEVYLKVFEEYER